MKILTYDIETAPLISHTWGIWQQNVSIGAIKQDGYILSWAAKWYGDDTVMNDNLQRHGNKIEKQGDMVKGLYDLIEEADVVVGFNSDKFDRKHINTAFLMAGMAPPSPPKSIDLMKVAKANFRFVSNKMDYILGKLDLPHKMSNAGFQLWVDCMNGKQEAWDEMQAYNDQDVIVTELLLDRLKPWIKNWPTARREPDDLRPTCNNCGSTHVNRKGIETLKATAYQRYKCSDCGNNMRGKELMNTQIQRKTQLVNI
jgi:hypothetical protein